MKKKLTAIFLCVALVAIAIVGASLAYFTDTKTATNTFTMGDVKIKLGCLQSEAGDGTEEPVNANVTPCCVTELKLTRQSALDRRRNRGIMNIEKGVADRRLAP